MAGLTTLSHLSLENNSISDISAVAGLTSLGGLSLDTNSISDITALSGVTGLSYLNLSNNSISDITTLSALPNLTHLRLSNNRISDIAPLVSNEGVGPQDYVYIDANTLDCEDPTTQDNLAILAERGADVSHDCDYR